MTGWAVAECATTGVVLGGVGSGIIRRFVSGWAGSWWLGAILTAVVLGVLGWRVGCRGELAVYAFAAWLGVPLALIDWTQRRLPRVVVWPQLAGVAVGFAALSLVRGDAGPGVRAAWAAVAVAGFYLGLAVLSEGGVGSGDVSLGAVVGMVAGWSGWSEVAGALIVASVLALLLLVAPSARRSHDGHRAGVPFGPCLLTGMVVAVAVAAG